MILGSLIPILCKNLDLILSAAEHGEEVVVRLLGLVLVYIDVHVVTLVTEGKLDIWQCYAIVLSVGGTRGTNCSSGDLG